MKIGGVPVTKCEGLLVLPRPDGDLVFRAQAVSINEELDKKVPPPIPPTLVKKGKSVPDTNDADYLRLVKLRDEQRFALMVLRSLEPSDIEWDTVDIDKPSTWINWQEDLKDDGNGLSDVEINRVVGVVMEANSLDEEKIDAARKAFLLGQEA